jgi:probable rRNA maturation factor
MIRIAIANHQRRLALDRPLIRRAIRTVLAGERFSSAKISLAIVDDPTIHELNRRYLDHDYPTDVLSFFIDFVENHRQGPHLEGEIVVSADTARAAAKQLGWKAHHELLLYIVHGMLHLVGYEDHKPRKAKEMRQKEHEVLAALGLPPPPDR